MGMTIAEKILASKGGRETVRPGDIVTVEVDTVIHFDNNFMPANWRDIVRVRDPRRIVVVMHHRVPAPNQMAAARTRRGALSRKSSGSGFRSAMFGEGDLAVVDFDEGLITNACSGKSLLARKIPPQLVAIVNARGIFALLEREGSIAPKASA